MFSDYTVLTNHYGGALHSKFHNSQSNDILVGRWMLVITNKYLMIFLELKKPYIDRQPVRCK